LEAVNPVVLGKVRARQLTCRDGPYSSAPVPPSSMPTSKYMSIQIHGDAAFSAQGVVTESLGLANLPHFNVGGTLHLIVNNQLGFTTEQDQGRSSHSCSDVVKAIGAPVIHVNGGYPEVSAYPLSMGISHTPQEYLSISSYAHAVFFYSSTKSGQHLVLYVTSCHDMGYAYMYMGAPSIVICDDMTHPMVHVC
jgi:hypothetical protein